MRFKAWWYLVGSAVEYAAQQLYEIDYDDRESTAEYITRKDGLVYDADG